MTTVAAALVIARKDLRLYFRDRTGVALGFLLPIVLVAAMGFVSHLMAGGESGSAFSRATLWVADGDGSDASREFVAALREAKTIAVRPRPDEKPAEGAALRRRIADGDLHHALLIEEGFGAAIGRGELPPLRMLRDPDRALEEQLISIGLMHATFAALGPDFAAPLTTRALELAGLPPEWRERTLALARGFSRGVEALFREREEREGAGRGKVGAEAAAAGSDGAGAPSFDQMFTQIVPVTREDFRPPERPRQLTFMLAQTVSGMSVMMLMFGLVACATLLLREREGGTLPRLLLAPGARSAILWGKFLFTAVIGLLQLVVLFGFGASVFHVDVLRDPVTFAAVTLSVLATCTAFGMLIGAWARTTKQAEGLSTLVILVMAAVGGAWFPLQMLELATPVKVIMGCTLTHWAVSAYQALFWKGKDLADPELLTAIGVLWGFALAASALARRLFERRYVGS